MNVTADRLYELLPVLHRRRDAEQGYPLKALLRVISEQVDVVEEDICQLYDNWFIETCRDWAVPYVGDLIGYRRVEQAGLPGDVDNLRARLRNRIIIPRREVAKTVGLRRRKGTLAVLEDLAWDVASWPARAVDFRRLVSQTQAINHLRLDRGRAIDVHSPLQLDLISGRRLEPESDDHLEPAEAQHERLISHGAFDTLAHTIDVRRIDSRRTRGRYNLPNVGLFVFRLKSYPICKVLAPTHRLGSERFTFSPLRIDMPLFIKPTREERSTRIAEEKNLPVPLRRQALHRDLETVRETIEEELPFESQFYGEGKSLAIFTEGWDGHSRHDKPVPAKQVYAADLSDWEDHLPSDNQVYVDPVLGRILFPPKQYPDNVYVSCHYGFNDDIGGGQYERQLSAPDGAFVYQVGKDHSLKTINGAYEKWLEDLDRYDPKPINAVIELTDNGEYNETLVFNLPEGHSLQLRAINGRRPVVRLLDWAIIDGGKNSSFVLDGILLTSWPLRIRGDLCDVTIRHSTLLPGSTLAYNCKPERPSDLSLELEKTKAAVNVERSIVGSIRVKQDEVSQDPVRIRLADSILDATSEYEEALGSNANLLAHSVLTVERSTIIGYVETHAIELAENSIFLGRVTVGRRQLGCMRFCYVDPHLHDPDPERLCSRTPRRYRCQPDLVRSVVDQNYRDLISIARDEGKSEAEIKELESERDACLELEHARVKPTFNALRYGLPSYCQLAQSCAKEIKCGADDQSEMGVFHDLFEAQRRAVLDARLDEFTPADTDAGIIYAT